MRRLALVILSTSLLAGCGEGGSTGPGGEANIAGTYNLQMINGQPPPVTILQIGTYGAEVTDGSFTVNANGTFSATHFYRETEVGQVSTFWETCTGSYSRTGSSLGFSEATSGHFCGGSYSGTVSGTNLTIAYDAQLQAVYRR